MHINLSLYDILGMKLSQAIHARRTESMHPKNQTCSSLAGIEQKRFRRNKSGNDAATVAAQARGAAGRLNPQQENSTQEHE
jgi:hypothetical protein